ncbi:MAG: glycosyltransferase family 1 protein [Candidatus Woesebacteria bacterium]|nr:glycosyltransferase family 1 protein [Candidatus Woesebacteria bacterium]
MKVGIDLGGLSGGHKVRGIGVHTSELIKALSKIKEKGIEVSEYKPGGKYDLIHYTVFKPFTFSIPLKKEANKVVLTIHDLIPLIYPKHYPGGIKGNLTFLIQKLLIKKNVDAIITISETSKKDICRFLGVDPSIVHVVYLAPKKVFTPITDLDLLSTIQKKYGLPSSLALYVGDVNYNKNIPGLIEMCKYSNIRLVIVGKQAKDIENQNLDHPELKHLEGLDWSNVTRLGFVDDEDLAVIYNLADVYIQPSLYEGFSLPPLEAKACGTWVIATKIQTHVEILDNKRDYSWEKTAKETLKIYKNV